MVTQKIPLVSEKLLDSVGEELSPQQRHTLRQRARQYEEHLREARMMDPTIGPTGFMLGMIERRLDRIESNSKDVTQMLLAMFEKCQVNRDQRLAVIDKKLYRLGWQDVGIASVLTGFLVGGRDLAVAMVKGILSKLT